jgi:methylglutaconyl-CoA hydratase
MTTIRDEHALRTITLDRAEKKNALTLDMLEQLANALHSTTHSHEAVPRAILLQGLGDTFCSGFDMALCRDDPRVLADMLTGLSRVVRAMRAHPAAIVVAVTGAAVAGGCALVAAADYVVTHSTAKLGYPVVRLGISPAVNVPTLRLAIGDGMCRTRALDPSLISGAEAHRIGLAHECMPTSAQCAERAALVARELTAKGDALATTKMWLNEVDGSLDTVPLNAALNASLELVGSHEQLHRVAALWTKK